MGRRYFYDLVMNFVENAAIGISEQSLFIASADGDHCVDEQSAVGAGSPESVDAVGV